MGASWETSHLSRALKQGRSEPQVALILQMLSSTAAWGATWPALGYSQRAALLTPNTPLCLIRSEFDCMNSPPCLSLAFVVISCGSVGCACSDNSSSQHCFSLQHGIWNDDGGSETTLRCRNMARTSALSGSFEIAFVEVMECSRAGRGGLRCKLVGLSAPGTHTGISKNQGPYCRHQKVGLSLRGRPKNPQFLERAIPLESGSPMLQLKPSEWPKADSFKPRSGRSTSSRSQATCSRSWTRSAQGSIS